MAELVLTYMLPFVLRLEKYRAELAAAPAFAQLKVAAPPEFPGLMTAQAKSQSDYPADQCQGESPGKGEDEKCSFTQVLFLHLQLLYSPERQPELVFHGVEQKSVV